MEVKRVELGVVWEWKVDGIGGQGEQIRPCPIQFGYRLWPFLQRRNKREILENIKLSPNRMSGSAISGGRRLTLIGSTNIVFTVLGLGKSICITLQCLSVKKHSEAMD